MAKFGYTCEKCHTVTRLTEAQARNTRSRCGGRILCDICKNRTRLGIPDAQIKQAISRSDTRRNSDKLRKQSSRQNDGVIATLRNQDHGALMTVHRPGNTPAEALRDVANTVDKLAGEWRIVSISTPNTILDDLNTDGSVREETAPGAAGNTELADYKPDSRYRERRLLIQIGRLDLLEPPKQTAHYPRRGGPPPKEVAA